VHSFHGRGERVNGCHLRKMQINTRRMRKVENLHNRAFSLKDKLLKYVVRIAFNITKILYEVIAEGVALTGISHP
jgi:hypothetical protein